MIRRKPEHSAQREVPPALANKITQTVAQISLVGFDTFASKNNPLWKEIPRGFRWMYRFATAAEMNSESPFGEKIDAATGVAVGQIAIQRTPTERMLTMKLNAPVYGYTMKLDISEPKQINIGVTSRGEALPTPSTPQDTLSKVERQIMVASLVTRGIHVVFNQDIGEGVVANLASEVIAAAPSTQLLTSRGQPYWANLFQ